MPEVRFVQMDRVPNVSGNGWARGLGEPFVIPLCSLTLGFLVNKTTSAINSLPKVSPHVRCRSTRVEEQKRAGNYRWAPEYYPSALGGMLASIFF